MKKLLKASMAGIFVSSLIFVITQIVFCITNHGAMVVETDMLVGCLIIGVGFGAPTVIYDAKSLSRCVKALIHMGFGCTIMILVSVVCYLPSSGDVELAVVNEGAIILAELAVAYLVWLGFRLFYRMEARSINKNIRQIQSKREE